MSYLLDESMLDVTLSDGEIPSPGYVLPTDSVCYGLLGLQNANIITQYVRVSPPVNELSARGYPRTDGSYAETSLYSRSVITIGGTIVGNSRTEMETVMDSLAKALAQRGSMLKFSRAGTDRYFDNCYPMNIDSLFGQREHHNITSIPWEIQLTSLGPFARSADRERYTAASLTLVSPTNYEVVNTGTAPSQVNFSVTVVVAGTASDITFANLSTGETLTVTATFSDGDQLIIDGEAKRVLLNGDVVDYDGVIPSMQSGTNELDISVTGTGWSLSVDEQHYKRYY